MTPGEQREAERQFLAQAREQQRRYFAARRLEPVIHYLVPGQTVATVCGASRFDKGVNQVTTVKRAASCSWCSQALSQERSA